MNGVGRLGVKDDENEVLRMNVCGVLTGRTACPIRR
jgi:hypothetical protein